MAKKKSYPTSRNKVSKKEHQWLDTYRIMIIDSRNDEESFASTPYGVMNNAREVILRTYTADLGFPKPRTFSLLPWTERGIYVTSIVPKQTFRQVRLLSTMRKRRVFVLWGAKANALYPAIEPGMGHLVMRGNYPALSHYTYRAFNNARWYSTIADWLGVTRELWRQ